MARTPEDPNLNMVRGHINDTINGFLQVGKYTMITIVAFPNMTKNQIQDTHLILRGYNLEDLSVPQANDQMDLHFKNTSVTSEVSQITSGRSCSQSTGLTSSEIFPVAQESDHTWKTSSDESECERDIAECSGDPRIDSESEQDPIHVTKDSPSAPASSRTHDTIGVIQNIDPSESIMQVTAKTCLRFLDLI
jgi:hypothetical protein